MKSMFQAVKYRAVVASQGNNKGHHNCRGLCQGRGLYTPHSCHSVPRYTGSLNVTGFPWAYPWTYHVSISHCTTRPTPARHPTQRQVRALPAWPLRGSRPTPVEHTYSTAREARARQQASAKAKSSCINCASLRASPEGGLKP